MRSNGVSYLLTVSLVASLPFSSSAFAAPNLIPTTHRDNSNPSHVSHAQSRGRVLQGALCLRGENQSRRKFLRSSGLVGAAAAVGTGMSGKAVEGSREIRLLILAEPHGDESLKELERLPPGATIVARTNSLSDLKSKEELLKTVNVVLVSHILGVSMSSFLSSLWPLVPNLEWVYARSAGIDHLICPELIRQVFDYTGAHATHVQRMTPVLRDKDKVKLTNARGVFSHSLAEFTMLGCAYFAKDLPRWERNKKAKQWDRYIVKDIKGATMGIIGYGDVGQACGRLAKAYGMNIVAIRRRPELSDGDGVIDKCYGPDQVKQLMSVSDYVCVAAPLTASTKGLVTAECLKAAKPGCVLINVGRGAVVDEAAMIAELKVGGSLHGAALDVFATEPLPPENELWTLPNVMMSPHNADNTATFLKMAVAEFVDKSVPAFLSGQELPCLCDPSAGY